MKRSCWHLSIALASVFLIVCGSVAMPPKKHTKAIQQTVSAIKQEPQKQVSQEELKKEVDDLKKEIALLKKSKNYDTVGYPYVKKLGCLYAQQGMTAYALDTLFQCYVDKLYAKKREWRSDCADIAYEYYYAWRKKTNLLDYVYAEKRDANIKWISKVLNACRAFMMSIKDGDKMVPYASQWLAKRYESKGLNEDAEFLQARELAVRSKKGHPDQESMNDFLFNAIHLDILLIDAYTSSNPSLDLVMYYYTIATEITQEKKNASVNTIYDPLLCRVVTEQGILALRILHTMVMRRWQQFVHTKEQTMDISTLAESLTEVIIARHFYDKFLMLLKPAYEAKKDIYLCHNLEKEWSGNFGVEYRKALESALNEQEFLQQQRDFFQTVIVTVPHDEAMALFCEMKSYLSAEDYEEYRADVELYNIFRKLCIIKSVASAEKMSGFSHFFEKTKNPYFKLRCLVAFIDRKNFSFKDFEEKYDQLKSLVQGKECLLTDAPEEVRKEIYLFLLYYCDLLLENFDNKRLERAFDVYEMIQLCGINFDGANITFAELFLSTFNREDNIKGFEFLLKAMMSSAFSLHDQEMLGWLKTYSLYCFVRALKDEEFIRLCKELFKKYSKPKYPIVRLLEVVFYCCCSESVQELEHALQILKEIDKQSEEYKAIHALYSFSFEANLCSNFMHYEESTQKQLSRAIDILKQDARFFSFIPSIYLKKATKYLSVVTNPLQNFDQYVKMLQLSKENYDHIHNVDEYNILFEECEIKGHALLWNCLVNGTIDIAHFLSKSYALCQVSFDYPAVKFLQNVSNVIQYCRYTIPQPHFFNAKVLWDQLDYYFKEILAQLVETNPDTPYIKMLMNEIKDELYAYEATKLRSVIARLKSVISALQHGCIKAKSYEELALYVQKLVTAFYKDMKSADPFELYKAASVLFFALLCAHHDKTFAGVVLQALYACEGKKIHKEVPVHDELEHRMNDVRDTLKQIIEKCTVPFRNLVRELDEMDSITVKSMETKFLETIQNFCRTHDEQKIHELTTTLSKTTLTTIIPEQTTTTSESPVFKEDTVTNNLNNVHDPLTHCVTKKEEDERSRYEQYAMRMLAESCDSCVVPKAYVLYKQIAEGLKKTSDKTLYCKLHSLALKLDEILEQEKRFRACGTDAAISVRTFCEEMKSYLASHVCTYEHIEHFISTLIFSSCGNVLNRAYLWNGEERDKSFLNSMRDDYKISQNGALSPSYQVLGAKARLSILLFYVPTLLKQKPALLREVASIFALDNELDQSFLQEQLSMKGKAEAHSLYEAFMLYLDTRGIKLEHKPKDSVSFSKFGRYFDDAIKRYEELRKFSEGVA